MGHQVPVPTFRMSLLTGSPLLLTEITSSLGNQLLHVNEVKEKKSIKHRKEPQRFNGPIVKSNRLRLSVRLERQRRTLIAE